MRRAGRNDASINGGEDRSGYRDGRLTSVCCVSSAASSCSLVICQARLAGTFVQTGGTATKE
jgi:hypothetical protein